jgi:hypothetical protein
MSQHCDTSHFKAEVIFSLPSGGKEGRVISFNPPVTVEFGNFIESRLSKNNFSTGFIEPFRIDFFLKDSLNPFFVTLKEVAINNNFHYQLVKRDFNTGGFPDVVIATYLMDHFPYLSTSDVNNYLVISDNRGTLFHQQYPNGITPKWTVQCYGCPNGEVAISQDGGEEFICIDKSKVIGDIGNIRSKTISIMKYLNL